MKSKKQISGSAAALRLRFILVPINFSKQARKALRHAIPLASRFGARIILLHVVRTTYYPAEMGMIMMNGLFATGTTRQRLTALGQKLIPAKLRGKVFVRTGEPFYEIARVARETKAGLIVCTTHGYTGFKHVVLGSTAERVVRHAPCPVLTIKAR